MAYGVTGNTSDFGSEESRFEPQQANYYFRRITSVISFNLLSNITPLAFNYTQRIKRDKYQFQISNTFTEIETIKHHFLYNTLRTTGIWLELS